MATRFVAAVSWVRDVQMHGPQVLGPQLWSTTVALWRLSILSRQFPAAEPRWARITRISALTARDRGEGFRSTASAWTPAPSRMPVLLPSSRPPTTRPMPIATAGRSCFSSTSRAMQTPGSTWSASFNMQSIQPAIGLDCSGREAPFPALAGMEHPGLEAFAKRARVAFGRCSLLRHFLFGIDALQLDARQPGVFCFDHIGQGCVSRVAVESVEAARGPHAVPHQIGSIAALDALVICLDAGVQVEPLVPRDGISFARSLQGFFDDFGIGFECRHGRHIAQDTGRASIPPVSQQPRLLQSPRVALGLANYH